MFWREDSGTVLIEFALVASLVGLAFLAAGTAVGPVTLEWSLALDERIEEGLAVLTALQSCSVPPPP